MDLRRPEEFEQAYDRHAGSVYAAAYRVLGDHARAQDVVQDVFLRVWRRPGGFDPGRGDLGTYLRLMARSRAVDLLREDQAAGRMVDRLRVAEATVPLSRPASERPGEALERDEDRAAVRAAVRGLPQPQREALVRAYWRGLTAEEIARGGGIPLGTVKSRLRLALVKLRRECAGLAAA